MTAFNPPPGWPVKPGFTPVPDWSPDPSWPAAPTGWRFWVDEPEVVPVEIDDEPWAQQVAVPVIGTHQTATAPTQPAVLGYAASPSKYRRTVLIAGALALVLVAAITTVVVWKQQSKGPAGRPDNMLATTFPTKPEAAWTVDPSSLLNGAGERFSTPLFTAADYGVEGAIVAGNRVVTRVRSHDDDGHLVAISLADGHVDWSIPSPPSDGCARRLVGNLLACQKSRANGGQSTLQFIDIDTGKVVSTADSQALMLASDGTNLYTVEYSRDIDSLVVAKGTPQDPAAAWKTVIHTDQCEGYGSGDALDFDVRNGVVIGYDGGAEIALHTGDGSPLFDHEVMNVRLRGASSIVANPCSRNQDADTWPTEVADLDGRELFTTPLRISPESLLVYRGGPAPFTTVDGQALDPRTGAKLWHISSSTDWVIGNIGITRGNQELAGFDMTTGNQLWHRELSADLGNGITDGERLIARVQESGFAAVSLADGSELWHISGRDDDSPVLYATDAGILSAGRTGITLYRPTGPAADVPEFAAPATEKSGG